MTAMLLVVGLAGLIGGLVNALMTDNGFIMPKKVVADQLTILRPGVLGNMFIGAVAAVVSWGLYGPMAAVIAIEGPSTPASGTVPLGLPLASIVGAILVGIGGAKWLTAEVDKSLLRAAAAKAASGGGSTPTTKAQQIALAKPAQALEIAMTLNK